jgi:hypothetical protein
LTKAGVSRLAADIVVNCQLRQFFIERQITIKTGRQSFNPIDNKIGFN